MKLVALRLTRVKFSSSDFEMRIFAQKKFGMAGGGRDEICKKGSRGKEFRIWRRACSEVGMEDEERGRGISRGGASNGAERNFAY